MLKFRDFFRKMNDKTKGMQEPEDESELKPLPIDMKPSREEFERLGFHFYKWIYPGAGRDSKRVETDQVMCLAKLPEGWKEGKWIGGYHYYLVDETGKNRIDVLAKNELWDRRGQMTLLENE